MAETDEILPDESFLEFLGEFDFKDDDLLDMALDDLADKGITEAEKRDVAEGDHHEK